MPFVTPPRPLRPEWIDYNGHLNMAYYHVLFDTAVDEAFDARGFGPDWRDRTGGTYFTAEAHVRYRAEVPPDALVRVSVRLVGFDAKRFHLWEELVAGDGPTPNATCEQMLLHVGTAERRVTPLVDADLARLGTWLAEDDAAPRPPDLGRAIRAPG